MKKRESRQQRAQRLAEAIRAGDLAAADRLLAEGAEGAPRPPAGQGRADEGGEGARGAEAQTLARLCAGRELHVATPGGEAACYVVRPRAAERPRRSSAVAGEYAAVLRGARQQFDELDASPGLCHLADARPEDVLVVRAESCGSGGVIFLIGLLSYAAGRFAFRHLLARSDDEEAGVLQAFADRRDAAGVLVTYDGRPGELERIRRRCEGRGIDPPFRPPPHLDLRAEVRKRWGGRLHSFSLHHVRMRLLQWAPSRPARRLDAADAYLRFRQRGRADRLALLLERSRDDLLAMAQLACLLLTGCDPLA